LNWMSRTAAFCEYSHDIKRIFRAKFSLFFDNYTQRGTGLITAIR